MKQISVSIKSFNVRALGDIDLTITIDHQTISENPDLVNQIIKWKTEQVLVMINLQDSLTS